MFTAVFPIQVAVIKLEVVQHFCEHSKNYHCYQLVYSFYDLIASIVQTQATTLSKI